MTFYKNVQLLRESSLYLHGLGYNNGIKKDALGKAFLLHWNGARKYDDDDCNGNMFHFELHVCHGDRTNVERSDRWKRSCSINFPS